jgi:hypothetical protein
MLRRVAAVAIALGIAVAWVPVVLAQAPSPDAIGVLIGLHKSADDGWRAHGKYVPPSAGRLRTLWIRGVDPRQPAKPVEMLNLLVPRRSGFWRMGLVGACAEEDYRPVDEVLGAATDLFDYLWAVPVGQQAQVRADNAQYDRTFRAGPCKRRDLRCVNMHTTRIFWVWPEFASLSPGGEFSCGAHPDSRFSPTIRGLDRLDLPMNIREALGESAEKLFREAFETAYAEYRKAWKTAPCADDAVFQGQSWYIEREAERWKAVGWSDTHRLCGYGFDYAVDTDLSPVTGRHADESLRPAPSHQLVPDADVHRAPNGGWALVATEKELLVFNGTTTSPILRVPKMPDESLVMVEWATGRHVARWNDEVVRLRRTKEPAPRVLMPRR